LTVKAVLSALITAEELGISAAGLQASQGKPTSAAATIFFNRTDALAASLGLTPGWAGRVVAAVGNYGEMFERNLGMKGPLKLERGPNRLVRDGGMIYALPF
jgi:general L-amino acid transport system substrate-binding protein